jgi:hypothetical protein
VARACDYTPVELVIIGLAIDGISTDFDFTFLEYHCKLPVTMSLCLIRIVFLRTLRA